MQKIDEKGETEILVVSTRKGQLDVAFIHQFLTSVYWAKGRSTAEVKNV